MPQLSQSTVTQDAVGSFQSAEKLIATGRDEEGQEIYLKLVGVRNIAPLACFRLGEILNRRGQAKNAYEFHIKAMELDIRLATHITPPDHIHHDYVYQNVEQTYVTHCPLCGQPGEPHWAFNMLTNVDFVEQFHPIRLWMHCADCHHVFAHSYPVNLDNILTSSSAVHDMYINPNLSILSVIGKIISGLKQKSPGNKLLDVGVGAGEMAAVAKEYGFDVTGIEIRPVYAKKGSETLDIPIHCCDFNKNDLKENFDVVCMGDVIEHMTNPVQALKKARSMLNANGILWISTPNIDSAFSLLTKDQDAMKRVCEHLNYFSYHSLESALHDAGFTVADYHVCARYNGSMEVTAVQV